MNLKQTQQAAGRLVFDFSMGAEEVKLSSTPFGIKINVADFSQNGLFGGPAIPSKIVKVALPKGSQNINVSWSNAQTQLLTRDRVLVIPLQKPQIAAGIRIPGKKTEVITTNKKFDFANQSILTSIIPIAGFEKKIALPTSRYYTSLPTQVTRLMRTEELGGNTILTLEILPLKYNQTGQLELVTYGQLTISYSPQIVRILKPTALNINTTRVVSTQLTDIKNVSKVRYGKSLFSADFNARVINPGSVILDTIKDIILPCEYLIITDNSSWNDNITKGAFSSTIVKQFEKLAEWKAKRGITSRVVTITDIVNGKYGNCRTGARDLQEVIRNFLKWALNNWGVQWVLLGGDISIIPPRYVAGALLGWVDRGPAQVKPAENTISVHSSVVTSPSGNYTSAHLRVYAKEPGEWYDRNNIKHIVRRDTGSVIPFDTAGTSSDKVVGWFFTSDDTYQTRSTNNVPTDFIRINGPKAQIDGDIQILYTWNMIPTDLYYSSLNGPYDNQPGKHDWDENNNGVYGQLFFKKELDHIKFTPELSVGRAPVNNGAQAITFVDKVIAYEKFETPGAKTLTSEYIQKAALLSTNWGEQVYLGPPPAGPGIRIPGKAYKNVNKFITKAGYTLINLDDKVAMDFAWNLYSIINDNDVRTIPYSSVEGGTGWYYVKDQNDISMSKVTADIPWSPFSFPIPSHWIIVRSAKAEELNPKYFVLDRMDADSSMMDQELLKVQFQNKLPFLRNIKRLYQDIDDLPAANLPGNTLDTILPNSVRNVLNDGQHLVCLSGHGNTDGCCYLSRDIASNLINDTKFIAYGNSCLTNSFDMDSMSKRLITNNKGGAVAYVGYSRFSWIESGDDFMKRFFESFEHEAHIGLLHDQRTLNIRDNDWFAYDVWTIMASNLLGCPEMKIWKSAPLKLATITPVTTAEPFKVNPIVFKKNIKF